MIQYICKQCGAQLELGSAGGFRCSYCGARAFLSDAELKGNTEFRKKLLSYYKAKADAKEQDYSGDTLWEENGSASYRMQNGKTLTLSYMDHYSYPELVCYLCRETVVYVFDREEGANAFLRGLSQLAFPAADVKLVRCFPQLKSKLYLDEGKLGLVYTRKPYFYPAEVFAPFASEHLAWVISRMENICCALEYSELEHGNITAASLFINPITHEGMLFGDWRAVKRKESTRDLRDLREAAKSVAEDLHHPRELETFLQSEPAADAYADFAAWDKVIEDGYGGHRFTKMD